MSVSIVAIDPSSSKAVESNQGFLVLARYIGVFDKPENYRSEAMAITALVIKDSNGANSQTRRWAAARPLS